MNCGNCRLGGSFRTSRVLFLVPPVVRVLSLRLQTSDAQWAHLGHVGLGCRISMQVSAAFRVPIRRCPALMWQVHAQRGAGRDRRPEHGERGGPSQLSLGTQLFRCFPLGLRLLHVPKYVSATSRPWCLDALCARCLLALPRMYGAKRPRRADGDLVGDFSAGAVFILL